MARLPDALVVKLRLMELARLARMNSHVHLTQDQIGKLFGFGKRAMRALAAMEGFPMVAKRINPDHFKRWLWEHHREIAARKLVPE